MKKCNFEGCNKKILSMIIDCKECKNYFCALHRLPEEHKCKKLNELKDRKCRENATKLFNEKCVSTII